MFNKTVLLFITFGLLFSKLAQANTLCQAIAENLREGDLLFVSADNFVFRRVARDTHSWTSHVGIAIKNHQGAWLVAESVVPLSGKAKLCGFLGRSHLNQVAVARLHGHQWTPSEIGQLHKEVQKRMGRWYDLSFNLDSHLLYCSKLVYQIFEAVLGVEIGKTQTLGEILSSAPSSDLQFWKLWYLGSIPWNMRTVTPASQLEDPKLDIVMQNLAG